MRASLLTLVLLHALCAFADEPRRVVAVIDFRSPDLSPAFQSDFEKAFSRALASTRMAAKVLFRTAPLPRASFEEDVRSLEREKPDIYYATTTDIARDIRKVNPSVPIVFSGIVDPRAAGIIRSIERPENNMTGFVSYEDIDDKRLEIVASLNPAIRRIGVLLQRGSNADEEFAQRQARCRARGLELVALRFSRDDDPAPLPALLEAHRLDALDAPTSVFVRRHHAQIIAAAARARIPASFRGTGFVERGGTLSYEPREFEYAEKAAQLVVKVLAGTAPGDIPVEFPSEFILSLNLTAAAALPYPLNKGVLKRANRLYP